jgi:hypothetical protein
MVASVLNDYKMHLGTPEYFDRYIPTCVQGALELRKQNSTMSRSFGTHTLMRIINCLCIDLIEGSLCS